MGKESLARPPSLDRVPALSSRAAPHSLARSLAPLGRSASGPACGWRGDGEHEAHVFSSELEIIYFTEQPCSGGASAARNPILVQRRFLRSGHGKGGVRSAGHLDGRGSTQGTAAATTALGLCSSGWCHSLVMSVARSH